MVFFFSLGAKELAVVFSMAYPSLSTQPQPLTNHLDYFFFSYGELNIKFT